MLKLLLLISLILLTGCVALQKEVYKETTTETTVQKDGTTVTKKTEKVFMKDRDGWIEWSNGAKGFDFAIIRNGG